jgi:predicted Rossmann fold nucleotide-binding protein DprA/Smf involved in DNA uptake
VSHSLALAREDERYPERLLDLERPPAPLWARGDLAILQRPCVAIVGTRRATAYGERVTREHTASESRVSWRERSHRLVPAL